MRRILTGLAAVGLLLLVLAWLAAAWLIHSPSGSSWLLARAIVATDGAVTIGGLRGDLGEGLALEDLRIATNAVELQAPRARLQLDYGLWPLSASIIALDLGELRLDMRATRDQQAEDLAEVLATLRLPIPLSIQAVTAGPLTVRDADGIPLLVLDHIGLQAHWYQSVELVDARIDSPGLSLQAEGRLDLQAARFDLRLGLDRWDASLGGSLLTIEGGRARVWGAPRDYEFETTGVAHLAGTDGARERLDFNAHGTGATDRVHVAELVLQSRLAHARGEGSVAWGSGLDLEWDLALEEDPLRVKVRLRADEASGALEADLAWRRFAWPLGAAEPRVTSERGNARLSGALDDWRLGAELRLETPEYPGGHFELVGQGDAEGAHLDIERGEALGGTLAGRVQANWAQGLDWQGALKIHAMDLGAVLPDWPARLDAEVEVRHDLAAERLRLAFERLEGVMDGMPFTGEGGISWAGQDLTFSGLKLESGGARAQLDGSLRDARGVGFEIDVRRPGWVAERVGGQVTGRGRYAPLALIPIQELRLSGSDFRSDDIRVEEWALAQATNGDPGRLDLAGWARGLWIGDLSLESAEWSVQGDRERQRLRLALAGDRDRLTLAGSGRVLDWQDLLGGGWRGELDQLTMERGGQALLELAVPGRLEFSDTTVDLERICLDTVHGGRACVLARVQAGVSSEFDVTLAGVPLSLAREFIAHNLALTQRLDGELHWRTDAGALPSGRADIRMTAGQATAPGRPDEAVVTGEGVVGFDLRAGDLTGGNVYLPLPGIGSIDIDFDLRGVAFDGSGQVDGRALVELQELSFLEILAPGLGDVHGALQSDLKITGVTADPDLQGSLALTAAGFDVPYLGMQVRDLDIRGNMTRADGMQAQGTGRIGPGQGQFRLTAEWPGDGSPAFDLELRGQALRVVQLPDLEMDADADLRLGLRQGEWSLGGRLDIPYAHITPLTSLVSAVHESQDVVVVNGSAPGPEADSDGREIRIRGGLAVSLGERVRLETELAELTLRGDLALEWRNDLEPVARGAIRVDGLVTAWGPRLHVDNGQVRFPGVPVSEPVLDIHAERDVFGNSQVRTAGVAVTGRVDSPKVEAFTVPLTTVDRAWAVLLTGSDVNLGQGVGALDVGTYIAPRLYLSYGVSLFESENVVGIRYDLRKGWGVKATSGQRDSGIDISYTIDH